MDTKLIKIASKSPIKPELQCIMSKGNVLVATDAFRLVELKQEPKQYADGLYTKDGTLSNEKIEYYPDYTKALPDRKPDISIKMNRKYIIECLEALRKGDQFDIVQIDIHTDVYGRPVIFTNKNGRAFIMPINK